jgi:hypothetical protein
MTGVRSVTEDFSSSLCVQTGSGTHPNKYRMIQKFLCTCKNTNKFLMVNLQLQVKSSGQGHSYVTHESLAPLGGGVCVCVCVCVCACMHACMHRDFLVTLNMSFVFEIP